MAAGRALLEDAVGLPAWTHTGAICTLGVRAGGWCPKGGRSPLQTRVGARTTEGSADGLRSGKPLRADPGIRSAAPLRETAAWLSQYG